MSRSIGPKCKDACVACGSSYCKCLDTDNLDFINPNIPRIEKYPLPPVKNNNKTMGKNKPLPERNQEIIFSYPKHEVQRKIKEKQTITADKVILTVSAIVATVLLIVSVLNG